MSGVPVLQTVMLLLLLMLGFRIQIDCEHEHEQEQEQEWNGPSVELRSCALNSRCGWPITKLYLSASCRDFPTREEPILPRLGRSDRSNLVTDQLPAGRHFHEDDAALELAAGRFTAVLTFDGHSTDRDRDIAAVNPDFHVRITFDGAELGGARFLVGQALCLGKDRAAGVDEGVIVCPNPFERGGISLRQGSAVLLDHLSHFLLGGFRVRGSGCLRKTERRCSQAD
jgi:hypothetical protein